MNNKIKSVKSKNPCKSVIQTSYDNVTKGLGENYWCYHWKEKVQNLSLSYLLN